MLSICLLLVPPPAAAYRPIWSPKGPFDGDYCQNDIDVAGAAWADVIAIGTLRDKRSEPQHPIYDHGYSTWFALDIERLLKGTPAGPTVEIVAYGALITKDGRWTVGATAEDHAYQLPPGARLLVYLRFEPTRNLYVVTGFWRLEGGQVVDQNYPIADPMALPPTRYLSESRLIELVEEYLHCSSTIGMLVRSDLVAIGVMESESDAPAPPNKLIRLVVLETIKGPPRASVLVNTFRGADGVEWQLGDTVLVFLVQEDDHYQIYQGRSGHFTVAGDSAVGDGGHRIVRSPRALLSGNRQR